MQQVDVLIIGTGTAGETAASILREAGLAVAIADRDDFGGTCALRGCQPKKYLVVPAHAALEGQALTERGFTAAPVLDWNTMQRSRAEFTDPVPAATARGLSAIGVQTFSGECRFLNRETVVCGDQTITARRFLIATGARPRPLPIPGGDLAGTSDDFLYLRELPEHVTFIGGGYISMEFATVAAAAGASVTVLQRGARVMDRFDPDLVDALQESCSARRIDIRTGVQIQSIERSDQGRYRVRLTGTGDAPEPTQLETDLVIAALGRVPNTDALNLAGAGVNAGPRGIETDASMRSSSPTIYAAGDCVASVQLSPVSDAEARTAARNIIADLTAGTRAEVDRAALPTVVFTYPQLAQFGLSETEATARGGVRINRGSGAGWPNYRRLNESHMHYKVMIDEASDRILGAHILAPHAGELINLFALAAAQGTTASEFREFPWAYPTYTSDLKYMLS